jgi:choline dehydrogenase
MSEQQTFDYVVVGAGSAGCVVAARLSEDPECSVLLLEAGSDDDRAELHRVDLPTLLDLWTAPWARELDWGYVTEEDLSLGGRRIPVMRGKVIGGCSAVNALMWVRGNPADYARWKGLGNKGWGYEDVLPHFMRAERYRPGDPAYRGRSGPITVHEFREATPVAQAFVAAAVDAGFRAPGTADKGTDHTGPDYNGPTQDGFAFYYQVNLTDAGERCSAAVGYLRPIAGRPNLTIATNARATKVMVECGRAVGVRYRKAQKELIARARAEIVLCAGAFETPKLLMLSGIGPAEHLARHGLRCLEDLPGVGRNLQDHLFVPVCYQSRTENPPAKLISEAGLFARTRQAAPGDPPDLQLTFGAAKFLPADAPDAYQAGPGFTIGPVLLAPRSRGQVRLAADDPLAPAVVDSRYLSHDADVDILVDGIELAREIAAAPGLAGFRGEELGPSRRLAGRAALRRFVRANASTLWHPAGTCRMGTDEDAVVDPVLRVHGVDGLRVADASIMPVIVSGNTNAPCVMIGEKAAELIREG